MASRVYVAGPYSSGDVVQNVRAAILAADRLAEAGLVPFVPHLTHFWHLLCPHEIEFWYRYDLHWLGQCQALLRLPGQSIGADVEVRFAKQHGIAVYCSIEALLEATVNNSDVER